MNSRLPYTLYTCPCTKSSTASEAFDRTPKTAEEDEEGQEDQTFNPKSARAKFALYPLEHLLFCNECHEIRCPKCYYEEASWHYCPTCLFDVQASSVKHESNRCTRSCYQCPVCVAPLAIQPFHSASRDRPAQSEQSSTRGGPWILICHYCTWSTLEAGIKFDKPVNLSSQLAKMKISDKPFPSDSDLAADSSAELNIPARSRSTDQYTQLVSFYKAQIAESAPVGQWSFSHTFGLDSPSQLSRLLTTYGIGGLKKQRGPLPVMREALAESEGLRLDLPEDDLDVIERMLKVGWNGLTSTKQQSRQEQRARFTSDLWPVATNLRLKRLKRCRTCRHILAKFDQKRQRNKYDLRIIALNVVPTISIKPMVPSLNFSSLQPTKTVQFLLTFRNPMFDPVKMTLATPPITSGRMASKVTILCPQFDVGSNTDAWDEALEGDVNEERKKTREALEGSQAIAGKVWEKGRNWTTVILEVLPGTLTSSSDSQEQLDDDGADVSLLEIPILVRMDYETDESSTAPSSSDTSARVKDVRVKREMVFWCVAAVGRIDLAQASTAG